MKQVAPWQQRLVETFARMTQEQRAAWFAALTTRRSRYTGHNRPCAYDTVGPDGALTHHVLPELPDRGLRIILTHLRAEDLTDAK